MQSNQEFAHESLKKEVQDQIWITLGTKLESLAPEYAKPRTPKEYAKVRRHFYFY